MTNKCNHNEVNLSYLASFKDAEERMAKAEEQILCPFCDKLIWETHYYDYKKKRRGKLIPIYVLSDNGHMSGWHLDSMKLVGEVIEGLVADMSKKEREETRYQIDIKMMSRKEYDSLPEYEC